MPSRMAQCLGYLGVLAALCALAMAVSCGGESGPSTAVSAPTAEPTSTLSPAPTPTETPVATATPMPAPTASPRPTPTATPRPTPGPTATPRPTPAPASIVGATSADVYERVAPSVAFVKTEVASGSGVLIEGGYVVTNYHVIWPFQEDVQVSFPNGLWESMPVAALDPLADIAVLGPLKDPLVTPPPPLPLLDGESLPVGSELYLVGYPAEAESYPQPSITSGILSRVREWEQLGMTYFQTDAAITGGQSGGALVNAQGEVIGISGFKFSDAGFGLVASAADVAPIVEDLINGQDPMGLNSRRFFEGKFGFEFQVELHNRWDTQTYITGARVLEAEIDGPGDGSITVFDSLGQTLLSADSGFSGVESGRLELWRLYHFLQVEIASGGPSDFDLTSSGALHPIQDPDDGRSIAVGETIAGSIDHFRDVDWYSIRLEEGETVKIATDSLNVDTVLYVDFPNSRYYQVVSNDDSGGGLFETNSELVYRALQSGEYYIIVSEAAKDKIGGYYLSVKQGGGDAFEPPPSPQVVDSPFGEMIVFESQSSGFSIQVPADWIEDWPGEDSPITFLARTPEEDVVTIVDMDLFAYGTSGKSLEEYADETGQEFTQGGFEVSAPRNITTTEGVPAMVLELSSGGLSGSVVISLQEERFLIFVTYWFSDETAETIRPLAEYSFDTLSIR